MSSYIRKKTPGNTDWFVHDRFGMFIHFGTYAQGARGEWMKSFEKTPEEQYEQYFKYFNPDLFDAREWARLAKNAGMKYAVLTAKHHEGFCLFDTKYTDYKITNTSFGRDLIKEYVEAFRAEGLKIGLYYSLLDWHHPEYTFDKYHPRRDDENAVCESKKRDMKKYAEYMRNQVTELVTNYGKIDILWFDFSYPGVDPAYPEFRGKSAEDWEAEKLIAIARKSNPDIIIDNRTGIEQDLTTPEQYQVEEWPRDKETNEYLTWEACHTFSGTWGYHRDELTWKSPQMLIETLCKTVAYGGNLLMNVGPCARGEFDERAKKALDVYGKWMHFNSRSIYGCTKADPEFEAPSGTVFTQSEDGKRLYLHLLSYPFGAIGIKNLADKIDYAQFLNDASEIKFKVGDAGQLYGDMTDFDKSLTYFYLPVVKPDIVVPVIEIFLK